MRAAEYWEKRAEENALRVFRYSQNRAQLVTRWFGRAQREMGQKITDFYKQYAQQEHITLQQAKAAATDRRALTLTMEQARRLAQQYPQDEDLQRLLRKSYLGRAVSREEFLLLQLNLLATELYGEYAGAAHRSITEVFEESYYRSIFDSQQFTGFGSRFNRISTHQIEAAATTAWQGKNYSQRIWGNHRTSLARRLNRIITTGFIEGCSGAQMRAQLQREMNTGAYEARRLIRTECCQVSNRASLLGYLENGTQQYQFNATLDFKTSTLCRAVDGKIFAVPDAKAGVNLPPMHPFCRSTTVPYWPDEEFDADETRVARNAKGEVYKVPANLSYAQWHKQYVKSDPAELLAEQKLKNGRSDAAQYRQYRQLLGKDAPKNFDDFQNIKYTDDENWRELKAFAQYKRKYPDSDRIYYQINKEVQELRTQGLVDKRIGIAVAPTPVKLESYDAHALMRMMERNFGAEDAQGYIQQARVEFRQFQNTRSAFYSHAGVSVSLRSEARMVTGWEKSDFDDSTNRIMEVLNKFGK